jgi:hypothetical protein
MSSETAPNTKHVQVPHEVPRDPGGYRATVHFGQRLRERVPEDLRDVVVEKCIRRGRVHGTTDHQGVDAEVVQFFKFVGEVGDRDWAVVVGIRGEAFYGDEKHLAVTVYEVTDD